MIFFAYFIQACLLLISTSATDLNVGTTLFTKADSYKECWSSEHLALLTSRMILEDLLPSTTVLVVDSNEFVCDLVEYFRLILETVRQVTKGKTKHITLVALTDLLGGYLYHAVLPISKYAYYAGLIDYDSMASLLALFDELKWFLRTNGQGWAKPLPQNMENFEVRRIPLQPCRDAETCKNLIVAEGEPDEKGSKCDATIPIPFFDSQNRPSSVALPTKINPLHNLEANSSSYLLMTFFTDSYKCLQSKNVKPDSFQKFIGSFCSWIEEQIVPRLADDKFYAAFGGILRVQLTLKRLGVSQKDFDKQVEAFRHFPESSNSLNVIEDKPAELSRNSMLLMAVLITIFVWFMLGTMFICYRMSASKRDGKQRYANSESSAYSCHPMCKKKSSEETNVTAASKSRGGTRQLRISTCLCHDDESSAVIDSNHTEHRLPSITEMSETDSKIRGKKVTYPRSPTESTTCNSSSDRPCPGKHCYRTDSDSETEESSEDLD